MTIFESRIEDLTQDGDSHPGAAGRQLSQTKGHAVTNIALRLSSHSASRLNTKEASIMKSKLKTTTKAKSRTVPFAETEKPIHPGEVLQGIYLNDTDMSQSELARKIGCPAHRINEIVRGKRGISAETALALEEIFGTSAQMWLNMQVAWDLAQARKRKTNSAA